MRKFSVKLKLAGLGAGLARGMAASDYLFSTVDSQVDFISDQGAVLDKGAIAVDVRRAEKQFLNARDELSKERRLATTG